MNSFFAALAFALSVTLPNILLLCLGKYLALKKNINTEFCSQASDFVFKFGLPFLLFVNLVGAKIEFAAQSKLVLAGLISTFVLFVLAEIFAHFFVPQPADKGVFVQGVFRSNLGIAGLAFIQNAYGAEGLAAGAVYMGIITIELNVLSVITLSRTAHGSLGDKLRDMAYKIVKNPLIVAIVAALSLNISGIHLPEFLLQTFRYMGNLALPLALICAGATFNLRSASKWSDVSMLSSIGRLLVAPIVAAVTGLLFGFRGIEMGILFLMTATPVAAASYVMAKAMGGNDVAAANIMGITTVGGMFSAGIGITILRAYGLM